MDGRRCGNGEEFLEYTPDSARLSVENDQTDAGRSGRTRLARPISQARKGIGKYIFSLFG